MKPFLIIIVSFCTGLMLIPLYIAFSGREISPVEYWNEQVVLYQNAVCIDHEMVRETKTKLLEQIAIVEKNKKAPILDIWEIETLNEFLRKEIPDKMQQELKSLKKELIFWNDSLKKNNECLIRAHSELIKHQQGIAKAAYQ